MYVSYLIYQAERPRSAAERRAEDINRGELAKALSGLLRRRRRTAPAAPSAPVAPVSPVAPACADRPALTLVKRAVPSAAPAAQVPVQRDNRTAC
jgi:hypothetical protein